MAEDIASLLLEVKSDGVKEGIQALVDFKDAALTAEEGAQQLVEAAQKLNVTVPLLRTALNQAIEDGDSSRVEQLATLVRDLGNAYQVAGVTGAQKLGQTRAATQAVVEAIRSLGTAAKTTESALVSAYTRAASVAANAAAITAGANLESTFIGFTTAARGVKPAFDEVETAGSRATAALESFTNAVKSPLQALNLFRYQLIFNMIERFGDTIVTATEAGEKLREFADTAGVSAESYQRLGFAALNAGLDQQKFNTFLDFFNRSVGEAERGNTKLQAAFAATGISYKDLFNSSNEELLNSFIDGLNKLGSAQQGDILGLVGGRGGKAALDFIHEGTAGIKEFGDELQNMGGVLSDADIKLSQEFTATLRAVGVEITANLNRAVTEAGGSLTNLVKVVGEYTRNNAKQITQDITTALRLMTQVLETVIEYGGTLVKIWVAMKATQVVTFLIDAATALLSVGSATTAAAAATGEATEAVSVFGLALDATVIGLALTAAALAYGTYQWYEHGKAIQAVSDAKEKFDREQGLKAAKDNGIAVSPFGIVGFTGASGSRNELGTATVTDDRTTKVGEYTAQMQALQKETDAQIKEQNELTAAEVAGGAARDIVIEKYKVLKQAEQEGLNVEDPEVLKQLTKIWNALGEAVYEAAQTRKDMNKTLVSGTEILENEIKVLQGQNTAAAHGKDALAAYNEEQRVWKELAAQLGPLTAEQIEQYKPLITVLGQLKGAQHDLITEATELQKVQQTAGLTADASKIKELTTLIQLQKDLATPQGRAQFGVSEDIYPQLQEEIYGTIELLGKAKDTTTDWLESAKTNADIFVHTFDQVGDSIFRALITTGKHKSAMDELKASVLAVSQEIGKAAFTELAINPVRHELESIVHPAFPNLVPGPPNPNALGENGTSGGKGPDPNNLFGGGTGFSGLLDNLKKALGFGGDASTKAAEKAATETTKAVTDLTKNAATDATNLVKQTTNDTLFETAITHFEAAVTALDAAVTKMAASSAASGAGSLGGAGGAASLGGGGGGAGAGASSGASLGSSASRSNTFEVGSSHTTQRGEKMPVQTNTIHIHANDAGSFHASKRQTMRDLAAAIHRAGR